MPSSGFSRARTFGPKGTPGWPGPPVRYTSVRGAVAGPAVATRRASVPGTRPERSSGTRSVAQVKPRASEAGHGRGFVSRGAGRLGAGAVTGVVALVAGFDRPRRSPRAARPRRSPAPAGDG